MSYMKNLLMDVAYAFIEVAGSWDPYHDEVCIEEVVDLICEDPAIVIEYLQDEECEEFCKEKGLEEKRTFALNHLTA